MIKPLQWILIVGGLAINSTMLVAQSNNIPEMDADLPFKKAPTASAKSLWDIQFDHDINAQVGSAGSAGCIFVNNQFWVAKWASDTLFRLNNAGSYVNTFTIA